MSNKNIRAGSQPFGTNLKLNNLDPLANITSGRQNGGLGNNINQFQQNNNNNNSSNINLTFNNDINIGNTYN
jgi:hypothetical protein